ncbi:polysaccharide deacetylase family protein [Vitiosangium sp. GDMCC 1.1324]|uniref:polysaccharide deacetylase family protein n=1 Tax=Vitiosangium sp. (strain GDMCC 1.1324) TaxID=2138576 RepID=UPI000D3A28CE|nr:polysaccharide deacetylase family protein [Vitiosangium sp. GDMCC 1.1324]PTL85002.1 polysaccharide deacetylase [Vitiosangium sp. GDMCC 1.1324]
MDWKHITHVVSAAASFLAMVTAPLSAQALPNNAQVPVLYYHSHQTGGAGIPCTYANTAAIALEQDLQTIRAAGFTVVPLYWVAEWARGLRDGSTLPNKVVAISFDDGADYDWVDWAHPNCGTLKSFRRVLQEFKANTPGLPWYSPHASSFVIASPVARSVMSYATGLPMGDWWWAEAQNSGIMEVYNHSTDHDNSHIQGSYWDYALSTYIPVMGAPGRDNFYRMTSDAQAFTEVASAAAYIQGKIGVWPDLFAYPNGLGAPGSFIHNWMLGHVGQHQTLAAFCANNAYVSRNSPPYCMPRFGHPSAWPNIWSLQTILLGSGQ